MCLAIFLFWTLSAAAGPADNLFKQGKKAEIAGDLARAYLLYSQAAALAPAKRTYWLKSQAVRSRAALQAKFLVPPSDEAVDLDLPDAEDAPGISPADLLQSRQLAPPVELKASPDVKSFDLRATPRILFEEVTRAFGLDVVFDGDYPQGGAPVTFRMENADYREALRAVQAATGSFVAAVNDRVLLAVKDTQQKRNEVEPSVAVVVPIPQTISVQDAQELGRNVQQVMDIRTFGVDTTRRLVLLKGPLSRIRPAQKILEDLLRYRSEVRVRLQFIEINHSDFTKLGLQLPTAATIFPLTTLLHNAPSIPSSISYLLGLGGGASLFGIAISDAQLLAQYNKSNAGTFLDTHLRTLDNMPATFHVGDRYPILTGGYFGPPSSSNGQVYTPPPSFNFEDLGLSVKVTPHIHGFDEVTLDIEAEFKVLGSQSFNGIPVISNRKLTSKVRLKTNETAILGGMMSNSEARSISGLAGLSQVPVLGALTRQNQNSHDRSDVVIVLRPEVLSTPPSEMVTDPLWIGTETRPLTPL